MEEKGHSFFITARDKEVVFDLLDYYRLNYKSRGKGKNGVVGKFLYIVKADNILFKLAKQFKPDLLLSFASPYAAQTATLLGKPHIAFDDTDHAFFSHAMYVPFTPSIVTPNVYSKDYGKKHIRFNGFMEMCSLLPKYFIEDKSVLVNAGIGENERYAIVRFVSWQASHDIGEKGFTVAGKIELVKELSHYGRVIISSEGAVPTELEPFIFKAHPAHMHQFLKGASLIVSESLTMAAEAAFLGTPAICISTAKAGTLDEEVKLGLIELYRDSSGIIDRATTLFKNIGYKDEFRVRLNKVLEGLIDPTAFMVWFVENYPESIKVMKENPDYQERFKTIC
jgi:predicted glycosyltransferase